MHDVIPYSQMGTRAIPSLLFRNSVPLMLSLLTHSLYNVVDSIFIARLSEEALTALSISSPVQAIMAALGCGIAVGLNAEISKAMGERNSNKVRDTASAAMMLAIFAWLLISLICLLGMRPYLLWQAAGNTAIYKAGSDYLRICMLFSLGQMTQWVFDRFLIATGRSALFLVTLSVASVVNLILDPILIFGYLGLPPMGTAGAAYATVIGQACGGVAGILVNARWNREIPLRFTLRVSWRRMADILRVGVPTAIMQGVVACSGIFINTILQGFSTTAIAVMGICHRLQSLALIPVNGVNNALIPIVAYNYGARNRARVVASIRWAMIDSAAMMGVVLLLLECFPAPILRLFDASAHMLAIGVPAIRIVAVGYFLAVFSLICSTTFQALGRGDYSMCLTLGRQVALPLGLAFALSRTGDVSLVWFAFALSELLSAPLAFLLMRKVVRRILNPLSASDGSASLS